MERIRARRRDVGIDRRAVRGSDVLGDVLQARQRLLAHVLVERAHGAVEIDLVRHDVEALTAVEHAERDDGRILVDVELAADDRLRAGDDLGRRDDRIDALPRRRAVALLAVHDDVERIRARHRAARTHGDFADVEEAHDVHAEHRVRLEILEHAVLDHQRRTAFLAVRRAFLGRLEYEHDLAVEIVLHFRQCLGDAEHHRRVRIVAARVHHADGLAVVFALHCRIERKVDFLGDRQRIHVGADRELRAGLAALQDAGDAGVRDAGAHLVAELLELARNELRRAHLAVAELRMLVQVAPPRGDLGQHSLRHFRRRRSRFGRESLERNGEQKSGEQRAVPGHVRDSMRVDSAVRRVQRAPQRIDVQTIARGARRSRA